MSSAIGEPMSLMARADRRSGASASSAVASCPRRSCRRARSSRRPSARRGPIRCSAASWRRSCVTTPGVRRSSASATTSAPSSGCGCCSSARTSTTPARTRSTTCSVRPCSPSGWARPRLIAETGAGQHGVAAATAAALMGLECKVYMGAVDVERQELNVFRMRLLGAEVEAVDSGSCTLKDAVNEALRDWVANVEHSYYCIGSVMGPHPYPWMVREFHRVIGDEAREQCLALTGRRPRRGRRMRRRWIERHRAVLRLRRHRRPAGRRRTRRRRRRRPRSARRRARHAQLPDAGRVRPGGGGAVDLGRPRLPGRRARARPPPLDRAGRVPGGHRRRGARRVHPPGPHRGDHRRLRVGPRRGLGDPRGRRAPRAHGRGQPVGSRRQGRRPGDGAARRRRADADRPMEATSEGGRRRPQAARAVHHRGLSRVGGRRAGGGRQRRRRRRGRHPVLRPGDGRTGDPAGVAGGAGGGRHAAVDPRRGRHARRRRSRWP